VPVLALTHRLKVKLTATDERLKVSSSWPAEENLNTTPATISLTYTLLCWSQVMANGWQLQAEVAFGHTGKLPS
jgi:hypothetical protein